MHKVIPSSGEIFLVHADGCTCCEAANVKPKLKDKVSTLLFFGHFNFSRNLQPALNENVGSEKLFLYWLGFVIVRRFQEEVCIYVPY